MSVGGDFAFPPRRTSATGIAGGVSSRFATRDALTRTNFREYFKRLCTHTRDRRTNAREVSMGRQSLILVTSPSWIQCSTGLVRASWGAAAALEELQFVTLTHAAHLPIGLALDTNMPAKSIVEWWWRKRENQVDNQLNRSRM